MISLCGGFGGRDGIMGPWKNTYREWVPRQCISGGAGIWRQVYLSKFFTSVPQWLVSSLVWKTKATGKCGNFLTNHQHTQMDKLFEPNCHHQLLELLWTRNKTKPRALKLCWLILDITKAYYIRLRDWTLQWPIKIPTHSFIECLGADMCEGMGRVIFYLLWI